MLSVNICDIAFITVKNVDYYCIIHNISKSKAINLLKILFLKIVGIYNDYCLNFHSIQVSFFTFLFSIFKVGDSESRKGKYKSSKISIGAAMKNPEMLKFVSDHLKTTKMCKYAV